MTKRTRICILLGVAAIAVLITLFLPPIAQPQEYHDFADQRQLLGVPHFLNVVSNLAFLLAGAYGLSVLFRRKEGKTPSFLDPAEGWPWLLFFFGAILVGFGSAFYHLAPDNSRLVWDRLAMSFVTMSLFSAIICERISVRAGLRLLVPLLLAGTAGVIYWGWSEVREAGDLRFYGLTIFLPLILIPLILLLFAPKYTRGTDFLKALGFYLLAKVAESLDQAIYAIGNVVSGHTLKHLLAAAAIYWLARMLTRREITSEFKAIPVAKRRRPRRKA